MSLYRNTGQPQRAFTEANWEGELEVRLVEYDSEPLQVEAEDCFFPFTWRDGLCEFKRMFYAFEEMEMEEPDWYKAANSGKEWWDLVEDRYDDYDDYD